MPFVCFREFYFWKRQIFYRTSERLTVYNINGVQQLQRSPLYPTCEVTDGKCRICGLPVKPKPHIRHGLSINPDSGSPRHNPHYKIRIIRHFNITHPNRIVGEEAVLIFG